MFARLEELQPLCEEIGFRNVVIDLEDDKLEFELEGDFAEEEEQVEQTGGAATPSSSNKRAKMHVGSEEFRHLQDYDMNQLCARVVVYGEK